MRTVKFAAVVALLLILGVLAGAALRTSSETRDTQIVACQRGDILSGYLQKRGRTLKGSTMNDRAVISNGRPIVDCNNHSTPLSRREQDRYISKLFECACEPQIRDGHVLKHGRKFH